VSGARIALVDMAGVSALDAVGVETLLAAHRKATDAGGRLVPGNCSEAIRLVLQDAGALATLTGREADFPTGRKGERSRATCPARSPEMGPSFRQTLPRAGGTFRATVQAFRNGPGAW
jgi:hypothetical protein